jgi:autonomous glycyl radical cofactor GrcA
MPHLLKFRPTSLPVGFLLTLALSAGWTTAKAASPDSAPPELKNTLAQIDAAANSRNVQAVMQFYGTNFRNSDGLNREGMEKTLAQLWQRYPQLKYRTELKSWQNQGNAIVAETVTNITGIQPVEGRNWNFNSTIRSQQRLENQRIVTQEILSEKTQLTSGEKPPSVDFKLPEQVRTGQEFNFDVVVKEPLKDNLLVGAALLENISPDKYLNTPKIQLEPLNAGGIFKIGRAPNDPGKYWISAVLVRSDGITIVSQRLPVIPGGRNNSTPTRPNSPAPARPSRPGRTSG